MSSERGNVSRTRPQRHQNARAFKNDKYDTSARCKSWMIRYVMDVQGAKKKRKKS